MRNKKFWAFLFLILFFICFLFYLIYYTSLIIPFIILFSAFVSGPFALLTTRIPFIKKNNKPIDMNQKFMDNPIFGKNKTLIGFVSGMMGTMLVSIITFMILDLFVFNSLNEAIKIGFSLGFGAMLGDLIKSFFKRRLEIKEGENWFPFDQIDFLIGAIIFLSPFREIQIIFVLIVFPLTILLHLFTNILAFLLRIKKVPW